MLAVVGLDSDFCIAVPRWIGVVLFADWVVFAKSRDNIQPKQCKETKNRKQKRIGCSEGEETESNKHSKATTSPEPAGGGPKTNLFQLKVLIGRSWAVVVVSGGEAGLEEGCGGGGGGLMIVVFDGNACCS